MFYVNNLMTGTPSKSIKNTTGIVDMLKKALINGNDLIHFDSLHSGIFTFNTGLISDDMAVYEVTDGHISILTKLIRIDNNTYQSKEDISAINASTASLKLALCKGWVYEEDQVSYFFKSVFAVIEFKKNSNSYTVWREGVSHTTTLVGGDGSFYCAYDSNNILISYTDRAMSYAFVVMSNPTRVNMYGAGDLRYIFTGKGVVGIDVVITNDTDITYNSPSRKDGGATLIPYVVNGIPSNIYAIAGTQFDNLKIGLNLIKEDENSCYIVLKDRNHQQSQVAFKLSSNGGYV